MPDLNEKYISYYFFFLSTHTKYKWVFINISQLQQAHSRPTNTDKFKTRGCSLKLACPSTCHAKSLLRNELLHGVAEDLADLLLLLKAVNKSLTATRIYRFNPLV